jgi:hypothetical protein
MSATLIWITCAVIVASLAVWLAAVAMAARNPAFKEARIEPTVPVRRRNTPMDL